MGCNGSKSTQSFPIKRNEVEINKSINPHEEDEAAEVIDEGKKDNKDGELDKLIETKKDESRITGEYSRIKIEKSGIEGIGVETGPNTERAREKPSFEKVEHKFEFEFEEDNANDIQVEAIDDIMNELKDI